MTRAGFSLALSGCFATLLVWGCSSVVCLVDELVTVQPTTIVDVTGNSTVRLECGNNLERCPVYCHLCYDLYKGNTLDCLSLLADHECLREFETAMEAMNRTDWCVWRNVISLYSKLSNCTEDISDCLLIPWPNPLVEETFVGIHSRFFKDCPSEELSDPPPAIVFALVITPICLIPVMVSLVVLKTKNGDGSS